MQTEDFRNPVVLEVTAISLVANKCVDVDVLPDKCEQRQKWEKKQNDPKYGVQKANNR